MSKTENRYADTPAIAIQVSRDIVVASIQVDLNEAVLERFREDLLQRIHQAGSEAVILDLSGLETLDSSEFAALRRIITTCKIMGADSVLVGLQPGVVSALIETGADIDNLRAAINLDAAFAMLQPEPEPEPEPEEALAAESESEPLAEEELATNQQAGPLMDSERIPGGEE
jgi:rsbT antagonist protein RsbS